MAEYKIIFTVEAGEIQRAYLLAERLWRRWDKWRKNMTFPDLPIITERAVVSAEKVWIDDGL